jgi:sporulation protein YlmC with PRC-barrel domain
MSKVESLFIKDEVNVNYINYEFVKDKVNANYNNVYKIGSKIHDSIDMIFKVRCYNSSTCMFKMTEYFKNKYIYEFVKDKVNANYNYVYKIGSKIHDSIDMIFKVKCYNSSTCMFKMTEYFKNKYIVRNDIFDAESVSTKDLENIHVWGGLNRGKC